MYRLVLAAANEGDLKARRAVLEAARGAGAFAVAGAVGAAGLARELDGNGCPDVLVLDTVLDEDSGCADGIDLVRCRLAGGRLAQVVYWDARPEHVTQAYTTKHVYHLLEPVAADDVTDALAAAVRALRNCETRQLFVRVDGKMRAVVPGTISFVESDRRRLHIHVGDEVVTTYVTLDAFTSELPDTFVRCHKSFVVNMRFVSSLETARVELISGDVVPVSQKRRRATREAFDRYASVGA